MSYRTFKRNKAKKLAKLKYQLGTTVANQLGQPSQTDQGELITGYKRGPRQTSNPIHNQTVLKAPFASTTHYKEQLSKAMKELERCQKELKELKSRNTREGARGGARTDKTDGRPRKPGRKCESCGQLRTTTLHFK